MKRLCLALALLSLWLGLNALAEGRVLSGKALYAANALAGQAQGAPTWHEGMLPEASWNAEQLDAWLDDVLDHALYSVRNTFSDLEVTLAKIEAQDPTLYAALTQGDNAAHFKRASALALEAEALRERLRATRDLCVMKADVIAANIDSLSADGVSARDQAMSSRRIEKAAAELRNARDEVLNGYEAWFDQIAGWQRLFAGDANGEDAALSAWLQKVLSWQAPVVQKTVSADVLFSPNNRTLLSQLTPAHSVLGSDSEDMRLHVMSDREFAVEVMTAKDAETGAQVPIPSAGVTVWDANTGHCERAVVSDQGIALFQVANFQLDASGTLELTIQVDAEGYRSARLLKSTVKKGGKSTVCLDASDGTLYFLSLTFNDRDILHTERQVFYSALNDVKHEIKAVVVYPDGFAGTPDVDLQYCDVSQKLQWITSTLAYDKGAAAGHHLPEPGRRGRAADAVGGALAGQRDDAHRGTPALHPRPDHRQLYPYPGPAAGRPAGRQAPAQGPAHGARRGRGGGRPAQQRIHPLVQRG